MIGHVCCTCLRLYKVGHWFIGAIECGRCDAFEGVCASIDGASLCLIDLVDQRGVRRQRPTAS